MTINPMQYAIYKGKGGQWGALQFNFQPPHFYKEKEKDFSGAKALINGKLQDGWKEREGAIFMEIASTKEKDVYDWDKKIVMALSINDMGKILFTLATGTECTIMHDPGAKSESQGSVKKYLNITSPKDTAEGCIFGVNKTVGGQTEKHKVPLTGDEVLVLRQVIMSAISRSLAW